MPNEVIRVVAGVLIKDNETYLMHQRPIEKQYGGLWEFPGGKVEEGESYLAALKRELNEELGIVAEEIKRIPVAQAEGSTFDGQGLIQIVLFRCERWSGEPYSIEGGTVQWFEKDEIFTVPKPPLDVVLAQQLLGEGLL